MNTTEPSPVPDAKLVSIKQASRLLLSATSLCNGPTERLAERMLTEDPQWICRCYEAHFEDHVGLSWQQFLSGRATLDQLKQAKVVGKRAFSAELQIADAGLLLYVLAVVLAQVHHRHSISSLDTKVLEDTIELLAGCARGAEAQPLTDWLDR